MGSKLGDMGAVIGGLGNIAPISSKIANLPLPVGLQMHTQTRQIGLSESYNRDTIPLFYWRTKGRTALLLRFEH